jgi:hypothetical protein
MVPNFVTVKDWTLATLLWLGLGFSLGWFYTLTYYGKVALPLAHPESLGAPVLYYFSVLLSADTELQAVHWMLVFPVVGIAWVSVLTLTAPYFEGSRAQFSYTLLAMALTSLPLILPGPVLAYLAGNTAQGFSWDHMLAVALRRAWVQPPNWLNPLYALLAIVSWGLQIHLYRKVFHVFGKKAWYHYLSSLLLLLLTVCGIGSLTSIPLHWLVARL